MASEDLKRIVAREYASGDRIADIARRHGYSRKGMKKTIHPRARPGILICHSLWG